MNTTEITGTTATTEESELAARVAEMLSMTAPGHASPVWVTVNAGRVTIHGEVAGWGYRDAIEHAVHRIEGVYEVKNWMTVRPEAIGCEVGQASAEALAAPA